MYTVQTDTGKTIGTAVTKAGVARLIHDHPIDAARVIAPDNTVTEL